MWRLEVVQLQRRTWYGDTTSLSRYRRTAGLWCQHRTGELDDPVSGNDGVGFCCSEVGSRPIEASVDGGRVLRDDDWLPLDRLRQLRLCGEEAEGARNVNRQAGEAVAHVLDQGVAARQRVRAGEPLEAPHWPQPLLEVPMIALQSMVEGFGGPILGDGQNQTPRWREHPPVSVMIRVGGRPVVSMARLKKTCAAAAVRRSL